MKRVVIAILIFFLVALGLYWQVQLKKDKDSTANTDSGLQPDFMASDLSGVNFNEKGQLVSRVSAIKMTHFDNTSMTYFEKPVYFLYPEQGTSVWKIQASNGSLNKITSKVVLQKDVTIDALSPDEPVQEMLTSYIELDLNTMIMTSDRKITITGKDFTIQGQGLYADINAQEVELTSNIEGSYEAQ